MDPSVAAGAVSTAVFAAANVPMLAKAVRTRDLGSYSLPSLVAANVGNAVHTVYVMSLPRGPIWVLHGFYLVAMAAMLAMYLRFASGPSDRERRSRHGPPRRRGDSMKHA